MRGAMYRVALAAALVCVTAAVSQAQQTSTTSETKRFEILAVDGNNLVVRLPEGTRELTVPDDFRFTVNGQQLSVQELKVGMRGTATITTRTTVTPVTVTEVKNGTVFERSGGSVIVQTPEGFKMFSQGELDKRGVKIVKNGKPVQLSDLNKGDKLTATIVTAAPPRIMTQKEVNATVPTAAATPAPAAAAPAAPAQQAPAPPPPTAKTLPKTASSTPLLGLLSVLSLAMGLGLTIRRRVAD
jgi:LPXTG cell wall anchor motif